MENQANFDYDQFLQALADETKNHSKSFKVSQKNKATNRYEDVEVKHLPYVRRIYIFHKYFGIGGARFRIETEFPILDEKWAVALVKIVDDQGRVVASAARSCTSVKFEDNFVGKAQQWAVESAFGLLGIKGSGEDDDDDDDTPISTPKPAQSDVRLPTPPRPAQAPPAASSPRAETRPEAPAEKIADVKPESAPVATKTEAKSPAQPVLTFTKEDHDAAVVALRKLTCGKSMSDAYFGLWTGVCPHDQAERFIALTDKFDKYVARDAINAKKGLDLIASRGKMLVNPMNLNLIEGYFE